VPKAAENEAELTDVPRAHEDRIRLEAPDSLKEESSVRPRYVGHSLGNPCEMTVIEWSVVTGRFVYDEDLDVAP
jgi:hypothetical protein